MASLFDSLRRIQLQERQSSGLASVSEDFFNECRAFLKQTREHRERGEQGEHIDSASAREAENFEEVLKNVVSTRSQKILFKAFRDLKAGTVTTDGLAREEKEFYNSLIKLFTEFEAGVLRSHSTVQPAVQPVVQETAVAAENQANQALVGSEDARSPAKNVKARFLLDLPRFPWQDSMQYGPFKKGEVAELRKELADFLNQRKAIELV